MDLFAAYASVATCRQILENLIKKYSTSTMSHQKGQTIYDDEINIVRSPMTLSANDNPDLNDGLEMIAQDFLDEVE